MERDLSEELLSNIERIDPKRVEPRVIVFMCCLCGEAVNRDEGSFGLALTDTATGEFLEQWWVHGSCLSERLIEKARDASPFLGSS